MKQRILGVDPGSRCTGWGLIEAGIDRPAHLAHGAIRVPDRLPVAERLALINSQIAAVVREWQVECAALETVFVAGNVQSALKLGQARGAALAALGGVDCFQYAPTAVKQAVAGAGRADKKQVAAMVQRLLSLTEAVTGDAADALAVALCHLFKSRADARIRQKVVSL